MYFSNTNGSTKSAVKREIKKKNKVGVGRNKPRERRNGGAVIAMDCRVLIETKSRNTSNRLISVTPNKNNRANTDMKKREYTAMRYA
jgi:hypothetical protein